MTEHSATLVSAHEQARQAERRLELERLEAAAEQTERVSRLLAERSQADR
jgi:hypothetical protein